ncbi:MAG TPA: hypothetical protein VGF31_08160 [Myxococcaceae bacterium]|jgi:hypothetical protein
MPTPQAPIASDFNRDSTAAATTVWAAVSRQLDGLGGVYCEACNIAQPVPADSQETHGVRPWATDPALAERLWTLSEEITGLGIA